MLNNNKMTHNKINGTTYIANVLNKTSLANKTTDLIQQHNTEH